MTVPNILLIMADQLAPQFTGTYGHKVVKTPHLDALAERGMRFDAAYCNSPLCAPSRFSFMSGKLISKIGEVKIKIKLSISAKFKLDLKAKIGKKEININRFDCLKLI